MKSTSNEEFTKTTTDVTKAGVMRPVKFNSTFVKNRLKTHREWQQRENDLYRFELEEYAKVHTHSRRKWKNAPLSAEGEN